MKHNKLFLTLLLGCLLSIFMLTESNAQDVNLTSQAQVNAFGATNPSTVLGTLTIIGSDITNLTPLSTLTSVGGDLRVLSNFALPNLAGLSNITSVGGQLRVENNAALTNLDGLSSLTSVGSYLGVVNNASLTNLAGLSSLTSVENLEVRGNAALTNLDGLSSLTSIGGQLTVSSNAALINLNGLSNLTSVVGYVFLYNNAALTNLDGLSNLTSVGGSFLVQIHAALTNLDGLSSLTSVGGGFSVTGIAALTNLDGLSSLTSVGGSFSVTGNAALTNLDGLSSLTSVGDGLFVSGNAALTNLAGLSSITSIGGQLDIGNNLVLSNIDGLSGLTSVGGFFSSIYSNAALTNIDGLSALTSVGGTLLIYSNAALTNIDGLSALTSVGENLSIYSNAALTEFCGLYTLLNEGGLVGPYYVAGNAENPTEQEIIDGGACPSPPSVTTDAASGISSGGATLNGTVNANNVSTTVTFEYGPTTAYGTTVTADQSPVSGTSNTAISKSISGLTPNTTYHFRVVGTNSGGTSYGADMNFTTSQPAPTAINIHEIQGAGLTSPLDGQTVTTENNIVTAVGPDGFFIQAPDNDVDADPNTSEGIYVYTSSIPSVAVGDEVNVTGDVTEFFGFTQFNDPAVTINSAGNPLPTIVTFNEFTPSPLGSQSSIEFERFEGMLIQIVGGTVTGPNQGFGTDPVAEVYITAASSRTYIEPGIQYSGLPGLPIWDGNPEVFELDPDRLGLPNQIIPAGSSFDAEGVLGYEFFGYELWPTSLTVTPATLPEAVRSRATDEVTVGTLNLFRLFEGATNFADRLKKLSMHIRDILGAPDILSVQEVENITTLQALAAKIQTDDPGIIYTAYLEEGNDGGGIDIGFLVRNTVQVNSVTQLGAGELFTGDGSLLHERPPLALDATLPGDLNINVLNVHLKSLAQIETSLVQHRRNEQATSISAMVQNLQIANPNLIVAGDFNAFQFTDGYVDVLGQISGNPSDATQALIPGTDQVNPDLTNQILSLPADQQYSFVFQGSAESLDHILTSQMLNSRVSGIAYGRGNADAAWEFYYDNSTPLRASDGDGLVLYLTPPTGSYDIYIVNTRNGNTEKITSIDDANEFNPSFAPLGLRVAHDVQGGPAALGHSIYVTNVITKTSTPLVGAEGGNDASWSPLGRYIVFDRTPVGDLNLYKVPSWGGTRQLVRANAVDGDWSKTGRYIVFQDVTDNSIRVIDVRRDKEKVVVPYGFNPVWSNNGQYIAYSDGNNIFKIRVKRNGKPKGGPVQLTFDGTETFNQQPSWSNNSRSIVFHSNRVSGDFDLWTVSSSGGTPSLLSGDPNYGDYDPTHSRFGRFVAYAGFTPQGGAGGSLTKSGSTEDYTENILPSEFSLEPNFPNPFNPTTTIRFGLPETANVTLTVFNSKGQTIRTLVSGSMEAGNHTMQWDGNNEFGLKVSSGMYFYRISAGSYVQTRKMILMK